MKQSQPTATGATVNLYDDTDKYWHSVCVSFVDGDGDPVAGTVTGTATAYALRQGADKEVEFFETLDLAADERSWFPFQAHIQTIRVSFDGLPADTFGIITINSWE